MPMAKRLLCVVEIVIDPLYDCGHCGVRSSRISLFGERVDCRMFERVASTCSVIRQCPRVLDLERMDARAVFAKDRIPEVPQRVASP